MALPNLSFLPTPKTKTLDTLGGNFDIAVSGAATCKPKHCGVCGECRQKKWQPIGDPGGTIDDSDLAGGDYDGDGWVITLADPDPETPEYQAIFYGPVFDTQAEADAACPPGSCTNTGSEVATMTNTAVYFPLSFIRNQTECAQYSASLPAGQSCQWFTTPNTTRIHTIAGSVGPES